MRSGARRRNSLASSVIDEDEQLMAAAHALHNLDLRFPAARQAMLSDSDRVELQNMRADLGQAFLTHANKLLTQIAPVRRTLAGEGEAGGTGTFEAAKRMDKVILVLFAGAPTTLSSRQLAAEFETAAMQLVTASREPR